MPSPEAATDTRERFAPPSGPRGDRMRSRSRSRSPYRRREDADRSPSPYRRSRSRSPARRPKKYSNLKFKEKPKRGEDNKQDDRSGTLNRGYREDRDRRPERQDRDRGRDRDREDRGGRDNRYDRDDIDRKFGRDHDRDSRRDDRGGRDRPDKDRITRSDNLNISSKFGTLSTSSKPSTANTPTSTSTTAPKPPKQSKPAYQEPMILVTVNDRLGTKAQIPCYASDTVKVFKMMVAAKIGRAPHEIMLKRQGERPFKDHITLGDYGVSNGVQLDLELDTGD